MEHGQAQGLVQLGESLKQGDLRGAYRHNPFVALGIAAGVGYILGGGLFTPFTARLLKIGARAFVLPRVSEQLGDLVGLDRND